MKVALITGVTGQTGSYLADLLLSKGYEVHGVTRGSPSDVPQRLAHILADGSPYRLHFALHHCDLMDFQALTELILNTKPTEIYNMAAQSSVGLSFKQPFETFRVDGLGVLSLFETVRTLDPSIRIFQASSSEIFGRALETPQNERTKACPCSPYANAKLMAHSLARLYREAYGMFVCSGILYNHESSRRGSAFVTQKIVQAAVKISAGKQEVLKLGDLNSGRDWGHAEDFADCIWRMLQLTEPDDFVVATGVTHTVRDFASLAFQEVGIKVQFQGSDVEEVGIDASTGKTVIEVDPQFFRPSEPNQIIGDYRKALNVLSWKPTRGVHELITEMVKACQEKNL